MMMIQMKNRIVIPDYTEINAKFDRVGNRLVLKEASSQPEYSSRKRKAIDDYEYVPEEDE